MSLTIIEGRLASGQQLRFICDGFYFQKMSSRRHDRDDEEPEFIVENILEKKIKCNKVFH